jgi:hypothetical protein
MVTIINRPILLICGNFIVIIAYIYYTESKVGKERADIFDGHGY